MSDEDDWAQAASTRREFLRKVSLMAAAGLTAPVGAALASLARESVAPKRGIPRARQLVKPAYRIAEWTGDDFELGHRLRNRQFPAWPEKAEENVDFVIIGGGIAGLTSAYYLRDHNFLLLEQYGQLGGQSRGGSYKGIDYSWGAAYVDEVDGIYGELYSELGLNAVAISAQEKNAWFWDGKWCAGTEGSSAAGLYRQWRQLLGETRPLLKQLPAGDDLLATTGEALSKLDNARFGELLKGFDPSFVSLIDRYCKSNLCGTAQQLSALAGLWLVQGLSKPLYVFKGGNSALARALAGRVEAAGAGRCRSGAFVWRVETNGGKASVVYASADGTLHRVDCRHVIVATPPMVASRIVPGLPDSMRADMLFMKYGSYLVANLLLKKKLFNGVYDNWVGEPFSFADLITAETPYQKTGSYKAGMGSVLTIYQPYEPGSAGRSILMQGDRQGLSRSVFEQSGRLVAHLAENLEEIVLSRWGHAMVVAGPGYYARLQRIQSAQSGSCTLAHSSLQGLACAESAIRAAKFACTRALAKPE